MAFIILQDGVDIIGPEGEFIWVGDLGMHVSLAEAIAYNDSKFRAQRGQVEPKPQAPKSGLHIE